MFIGHFAVGFAAKKFAPRTALAALIAAPVFGRHIVVSVSIAGLGARADRSRRHALHTVRSL